MARTATEMATSTWDASTATETETVSRHSCSLIVVTPSAMITARFVTGNSGRKNGNKNGNGNKGSFNGNGNGNGNGKRGGKGNKGRRH